MNITELIEFVAGTLPSGATISGMSWNGFNVYGDEKSMKEFRRWMTEVDRSEGLSRIIAGERTRHSAQIELLERGLGQATARADAAEKLVAELLDVPIGDPNLSLHDIAHPAVDQAMSLVVAA